MSNVKAPWLAFYGEVAATLDYPDGSMLDLVQQAAARYPDTNAVTFMGKGTRYDDLMRQIDEAARAFAAIGIREGNKVTLCMPNCPQIVVCFYALNRIGAIASLIHPLSSVGEIAFYIKDSGSKAVVSLDAFYGKFEEVRKEVSFETLVLTSIKDALSPVMKVVLRSHRDEKSRRFQRARTCSSGRRSSMARKHRTIAVSSPGAATMPPSSSSPAARPARQREFC